MSNFRRPVYAKPMTYTKTIPETEAQHDAPMARSERREQSLSRLIRAGTEMLCEQSYASMGVEHVLQRAGLSKGSFYHFFTSKEQFGLSVIAYYADYYNRKLERILLQPGLSPLECLKRYIQEGIEGVERFEFRRGCLIGNLSQELGASQPLFRMALEETFKTWQDKIAAVLQRAIVAGELDASADIQAFAEFFWSGWEGALIRAKLLQSSDPITRFTEQFFKVLPKTVQKRIKK